MGTEEDHDVPTADYARRVPNQPKTPSRNVRVDDDLWEAVKKATAEDHITVADVVRDALRDYLAGRKPRRKGTK